MKFPIVIHHHFNPIDMNLLTNAPATVAEMVTRDFRTADIFKKYGIDFCCGGKKTLDQVCKEKNLPFESIQRDLELVDRINDTPIQLADQWDLPFLTEYIIHVYHRWTVAAIPKLWEYLQKIAKVHGERHPELKEISYFFAALSEELENHMQKEEQVIFPYIKNLVYAQSNKSKLPDAVFDAIRKPILALEHEHESAGEMMQHLRELSNQYTPPEDACNTYRVAFAKLKEFEDMLFQHVHIENNILFPKAIALEQEVSGN